MTVPEWAQSSDPMAMLALVAGKASARKLRLFACAVCRAAWKRLGAEAAREAVEVAEAHADGKADDETLAAACETVRRLSRAATGFRRNPFLAFWATDPLPLDAAFQTVRRARATAAVPDPLIANLLRELFGPRPLHPVAISPLALARNDATIPKLARPLYEGRCFGDLPVLADALEEAGCDSQELLDHLRSAGPHYLGCWALDLVRSVD